ncbi:MAG: nicotinamide-nucleotide amidohydrolase family protein [Ardenticatenaceae bacterium]|nr:nicotinamide-nucleotide amidohydrolase family protein [Ardenticatenaceae bacterium]
MTAAELVGHLLSERGLTLAVAESCTGGLLGDLITDVAGSSGYFLGGIISYSNEAKEQFLGVGHETLVANGAVSPETAAEMAQGVRRAFDADIGVSITGIAGPGGGTAEKPVGLVYIGLADHDDVLVRRFDWNGTRAENKQQSAEAALALLREHLEHPTMTAGPPEGTPVAVEATFEPDGQITPVALTLEGRVQRISQRGRQWTDATGARHFLVMTTPDAIYELIFVPRTLSWRAITKTGGHVLV